MASDLPKKAREAFFDDDYNAAVDLYSRAIYSDSNNPDLYADRAQAYIKLNCFTEAVSDANKAIELDPSMARAYLRKGTACIKLGEYHTARAALEIGASLAQNDSRFIKLIKECDHRIAADEPASTLPPGGGLPSCNITAVVTQETGQERHISQTNEVNSIKPKYRHEYYQKPEEVIMTIFAKGIPAKNVSVDFGEQILSVTIDVPGQSPFHFQSRLFGKIIPDKCRFEVLTTKIEIRLAKAEAINWASLEYSKDVLPQKVNMPSIESKKPAYPSSKPRTKDWDKLEAQVKKEEKEEKLDGDAALNKLFRDIYQNADEDMRRAMSKSFVESNGTVLSTDWKEVGSKKVEGSPPDGMELKKWEY